jgi:hypothetical protein
MIFYVCDHEPCVNDALSNDLCFVLQTEGALRIAATNRAENFASELP